MDIQLYTLKLTLRQRKMILRFRHTRQIWNFHSGNRYIRGDPPLGRVQSVRLHRRGFRSKLTMSRSLTRSQSCPVNDTMCTLPAEPSHDRAGARPPPVTTRFADVRARAWNLARECWHFYSVISSRGGGAHPFTCEYDVVWGRRAVVGLYSRIRDTHVRARARAVRIRLRQYMVQGRKGKFRPRDLARIERAKRRDVRVLVQLFTLRGERKKGRLTVCSTAKWQYRKLRSSMNSGRRVV